MDHLLHYIASYKDMQIFILKLKDVLNCMYLDVSECILNVRVGERRERIIASISSRVLVY